MDGSINQIEFFECLSSLYADIAMDCWPSQQQIDEVVGHAVIFGLSQDEIDILGSVLTP